MVDAIASGSADAARTAMRHHLEQSHHRFYAAWPGHADAGAQAPAKAPGRLTSVRPEPSAPPRGRRRKTADTPDTLSEES